MSRLSKIEPDTFLTPRANRNDKFRVYAKSFSGNKQFDAIQRTNNERVISIDPEVIFRMATLGMNQEQIAGYWGIKKNKFMELCEEYPELEEVYLMGMTAGIAGAAQALEEMVKEKQMVPVLFRLKVGGFIEKEKLIGKEQDGNSAPKVTIFLPENGRDNLDDEDE